MKLHPRTLPVQRAGNDLSGRVLDWIQEHDLTYAEALSLLLREAERITKYMLRMERHPDDPDRKADEE